MTELIVAAIPFLIVYFIAMYVCTRPNRGIEVTPESAMQPSVNMHGLPEYCPTCGAHYSTYNCRDGYNDEAIVLCETCGARGCWYYMFDAFNWVSKGQKQMAKKAPITDDLMIRQYPT